MKFFLETKLAMKKKNMEDFKEEYNLLENNAFFCFSHVTCKKLTESLKVLCLRTKNLLR